jgi:ATP:ADP antiporter, AAA family
MADCIRHPLPLRLLHTLYGELPTSMLAQALSFSSLLCLVVGVYWLMRSIKDSVFATVVGLEYQPRAKMLSLVVVTGVLFVYGYLVERLTRMQLFVVVFGGYALAFFLAALVLGTESYGLSPTRAPSPDRLVGWFLYFAIESYGSLSTSMFWQFTNSQLEFTSAKAQYGMIVAGGQASHLIRPGPISWPA